MDFVLVHGAYHGAWCWDLLAPELQRRGHRVVAVDLPIGDPSAGPARYAEAVAPVMAGLDAPIVVGHSMGGLVVPLVAAAHPVGRLVFLAALLPEPGLNLQAQRAGEPIDAEVTFEHVEFTDHGDGLWMVGPNTATEMFFHDVPAATARWAVERLRPQGYAFMTEVTPLQRWPNVPSAYVVCEDDRAVNPSWGRMAARDRLGVDPHEIAGGHSPFLARPHELADLLHAIAEG